MENSYQDDKLENLKGYLIIKQEAKSFSKFFSEQSREPTDSNHIMMLGPGIKPRPHWWK